MQLSSKKKPAWRFRHSCGEFLCWFLVPIAGSSSGEIEDGFVLRPSSSKPSRAKSSFVARLASFGARALRVRRVAKSVNGQNFSLAATA